MNLKKRKKTKSKKKVIKRTKSKKKVIKKTKYKKQIPHKITKENSKEDVAWHFLFCFGLRQSFQNRILHP